MCCIHRTLYRTLCTYSIVHIFGRFYYYFRNQTTENYEIHTETELLMQIYYLYVLFIVFAITNSTQNYINNNHRAKLSIVCIL